MSDQQTHDSASEREKTVYENITFGLSVWKTNITRMFFDLLHAFEIKQLEKRLQQEYAALGKATSHNLTDDAAPTTPSFEMTSALKQISFLKDEITRLKDDHTKSA